MKWIAAILMLFVGCVGQGPNYNKSWSVSDRTTIETKLDSTLNMVINQVAVLSDAQWNWRLDSAKWSVAMVVEHLITHDELFYREVKVLTALPQPEAMSDTLFASDDEISSYGEITQQNMGKSPSYLAPKGRWCSKSDAMDTHRQTRRSLIDFVSTTDADLRKYYTSSGRGPTQYRDLHQLLLISVAHTSRHHKQILKIKSLEGFPKD